MSIMSRLNQKVAIYRNIQTTESSGFPVSARVGIAFNVPCHITTNSAARAIRYGKPTEVESGTAEFLPGADIDLGDTIQYGGRILRVDGARPVEHPTIGDVEHIEVEWTQEVPEATP